jgi:hypothetical protein
VALCLRIVQLRTVFQSGVTLKSLESSNCHSGHLQFLGQVADNGERNCPCLQRANNVTIHVHRVQGRGNCFSLVMAHTYCTCARLIDQSINQKTCARKSYPGPADPDPTNKYDYVCK